MDFEDIERVLELVRLHDLAEFELEREGLKLRVVKASAAPAPAPPAPVYTTPPTVYAPPHVPLHAPAAVIVPAGADESVELAVVKSPIVGTFYRTAEPGAPAFVEVGQHVKKDQVLCIIEAMKLMNEITSEYEGEIVNVYVENGTPVQYGERLFAVKTA